MKRRIHSAFFAGTSLAALLIAGTAHAEAQSQPTQAAATEVAGVPEDKIEEIVVTDTIPLAAGAPSNIRVLSCAELLTNSIRQIFTDGSVSEVFGGENQLF